MTNQKEEDPQQAEKDGCLPALVRIFWLLIGAMIMVIMAIYIAIKKGRLGFDLAFWLTTVALITARYLDIKYFQGQTAEGEPASLGDWRRYSIRVMLAAAGLYVIAKAIGHFNLL